MHSVQWEFATVKRYNNRANVIRNVAHVRIVMNV